MRSSSDIRIDCAIVGIGNVLMGDEGVGVQVVRRVAGRALPAGVACVDGGTGGLHLLDTFQSAPRIILIDATADGAPPGTVRRLRPRFSADYPRSLTAHDIGLKDVLDALYLLGDAPEVVLFAVSIAPPRELGTELSEPVEAVVETLAEEVLDEARAGLPRAANRAVVASGPACGRAPLTSKLEEDHP